MEYKGQELTLQDVIDIDKECGFHETYSRGQIIFNFLNFWMWKDESDLKNLSGRIQDLRFMIATARGYCSSYCYFLYEVSG